MKNMLTRVLWCGAGLFLVIMGFYFIIQPDATLISIALMLGLAMTVSGLANIIIYVLRRRFYLSPGWFLVDGVIDLLIGIIFLCNNLIAASLLPYIFGAWAIVSGVVKCINAFIYKKLEWAVWVCPLVIGAVLVLFGLVTFFEPLVAAAAISVIVAVILIAQGMMAVMRGFFDASPRK